MELTTQVKDFNGIPVVEVIGEMDMSTSPILRNKVLSLLEEGVSGLVINMDQVKFIDSTGLGTLVGLLKYASEHQRKLYLSFTNPMIDRVFQVTGLDVVLPFTRTNQEAIQMLSG